MAKFYFLLALAITIISEASLALSIESQPLKNLIISETKLKINKKIFDFLIEDRIFFQGGQILLGGEGLEYNAPFCILTGLNPHFDPPMGPHYLENNPIVDIYSMEGNYSDFMGDPQFRTEIVTSGDGIGEFMEIRCHRPSLMQFREMTIGEFESLVSPYIIFSKVSANIAEVPKFKITMDLDPAFVYQPNQHLGSFNGNKNKDVSLGITIDTDLEIVPNIKKNGQQEMWHFQNGKLFSSFDGLNLKDSVCTLGMRDTLPATLKKGTFLKAKSISARYSNETEMPGHEVPGSNNFSTDIEFETSEGRLALLMCSSSSLTPLTYNDTVKIFGGLVVWTIVTLQK